MFEFIKRSASIHERAEQERQRAYIAELEEAVIELAQNQADLEDAICELAELLTEEE